MSFLCLRLVQRRRLGNLLAAVTILALPVRAWSQTDLTISAVTYAVGVTPPVTAQNSIVTNGGATVLVPVGAAVTYKAGSRITLRAGFIAKSGSAFHAFIGNVPAVSAYSLMVSRGSGSGTNLLAGTVRTIVANPAPNGQNFVRWSVVSGIGAIFDSKASTTTFTMGPGDAIVSALFGSTADGVDTDGDGVSDLVESELGLNPNDPTDVNVFHYTYDKTNQLKTGPGGDYSNKDAEGNIQEVRP